MYFFHFTIESVFLQDFYKTSAFFQKLRIEKEGLA